ncbi:MAG: prohibitin family protein [Clostridia bacterium]|nr:prohibitin family protein [Clostridia bacterium]
MKLFLIGIFALIVAFGALIYASRKCKHGTYPKQKAAALVVAAVCLVVGVSGIATDCITTIPTGHTGIVTTFGRVENYTFEAGVHVKAPWQQVVKMDNRIQKAIVEMSCFSSDIQEVDTNYTINYQINKANAQEIYRSIGPSYYDTIILPRIQESVKSMIAKYDAEELIESREKLSDEIKRDLTAKLAVYNVEVIDASIENLDFSDAFTNAVEAKQVAAQEKLKAEIQQEQANIEAKAAAERAVIAAEAEAEKAVLAAEAEAEAKKKAADAMAYAGEKEAEANEKIAASLSDELIKYKEIEQWDGKLPTYMGGEGSVPVLNFGNGTATGAAG